MGSGWTSTTLLMFLVLGLARPVAAQELDFAIGIGSTGSEQGVGIAADASGNSYVTGFFGGTVDFDPGAGVTNLTSVGGRDIFVAKYDASGNPVFALGLGGGDTDEGQGIAIDASGNS